MKIVRRKSDSAVLYLRPETERVTITDGGLLAGSMQALDINSTDHEVVENVPSPSMWFVGGLLTYIGGEWGVLNDAQYREVLNNNPDYVATVKAQAEKRAAEIVLKEQIAAKIDDMPDEDKATLAYLYDEWAVGQAYAIGDIVRVDDIPYRVLQAHTSQADWTPATAASLYTPLRQTQGAAPDEWVAPTGAHDAYQTGDRVTFNGSVYESLIDANVYSPTAYPAGWQLVE